MVNCRNGCSSEMRKKGLELSKLGNMKCYICTMPTTY
jgi:hypothetical protein